MTQLLNKIAQPRILVTLTLASIAVFASLFHALGNLAKVSGGMGILDFEYGYDTTRVAEVFGSYGEAGMSIYSRIQLLDLINPALYALVLAGWIRALWPTSPLWLAGLPFLAAVGDYTENLTLFIIANDFPLVSDPLVATSAAIGLVKHALLGASFIALAASLVHRLRDQTPL